MNLIEDLLERSPASRLGIVAIDAEANRRDWHFGELIALLGRALRAPSPRAGSAAATW